MTGTLRKLWIIPLGIALILAALWLGRARLAAELAQNYFQQHSITSSIAFSQLELSGVSGKLALGPADAPDFAADAVEVDFDPLRWKPLITQVRLINPVLRARMDRAGRVTLPTLQRWLDSLSRNSNTKSPYVSDDLAISFSHLRVLLATPGGVLELGGDAKIRRSQLVSAAIAAKPAVMTYLGATLRIAGADLRFDPVSGGYGMAAHFRGSVKTATLEATDVNAQLSVPSLSLDLNGKSVTAPTLHLHVMAASLTAGGIAAANPAMDVTADAVHAAFGGLLEGSAKLRMRAGADFTPPALAARYPMLAKDRRLPQALQGNLRHLDIVFAADVARQNGALSLVLTQPARMTGARGGILRLASFGLGGSSSSLHGNLDAALSGPGLPAISLRAGDLRWQNGVFTSDAALAAHFDFAMLHGAAIAAKGTASFQKGTFFFSLGPCAPATLAGFHPGDSDLAQNVRGSVCAAPGEKTVIADASGWRFAALAQNLAMVVPLGNVGLSNGAGHIAFSGEGAVMRGRIAVTAARMTDRVSARRFEPLSGTGNIALDNWVWHGALAVTDAKGNGLGTATFSHALADSSGSLTIATPQLQFAPDKLQPGMLSPLLGAVSRAEGAARFNGVISWTKAAIQSHGSLSVDKLDFLTPLGTAHAVDASIAFSSLLPPVTAPGQHIAISRIDWALPLGGIGMDFSFGGGALHVESLASTVADGKVKLGAFTVDLAGSRAVTGAAGIDGVSLAPLVAASNLGSKIKLEGKVTGTVPFSYGPDGFRIVGGHLASVGPGRISLDRSIWNQGGAVAANAVEDLAYQALENLAYDQLTADINSIAGGRLQVVFHVKGRSDPPKPQQAEVAIADIINGTALQKPIALTSGTPIDLTLDTSLNFDELLKSYAEAWSKTLAQTGQ